MAANDDNGQRRGPEDSSKTERDTVSSNEAPIQKLVSSPDTEATRKGHSRLENFIRQIKNDQLFRQKIIHTAILCWSFVGMGWATGMNGPTFPDLRQIIREDLANSAWMFTAGSFGYLTGSLLGGILYDKLDKVLLLGLCSLVTAITTLLTPYCSTLPWMLFIRYIGGMFFGGLDTGGNADIILVWGVDVDPYMQTLHFAFSLGALLSPLATEPFLAAWKLNCSTPNDSPLSTLTNLSMPTGSFDAYNASLDDGVKHGLNDSNTLTKCETIMEETQVHFAFLIASILMVTSTIAYAYLYMLLKQNNQDKQTSENKESSTKSTANEYRRKIMSMKVKILVVVLLSLLMAFYCVAEDSFAGFLMTFSIEYLNWDTSRGSVATAVFWLSFGIGRFAGIFIVSFCKNSTLLSTYLVLLCLSYSGVLLSSLFKYYPLIWFFICAVGFSLSVIFPAIFSWTSEHIIHVSGKISSIFLTSSCLAGMLFPLLIGNLMEHVHPMWFVYILVIGVFACLLIYIIVRVLDKCCLQKQTLGGNTDSNDVELETEMTLIKE